MINKESLSNGIGDEWYNKCLASSNPLFKIIYSSFSILFHFDSLNWIVLELLILLPVFFRLYGFGIQQKLTKFYNKVRLQLIKFLFYFSLSSVLSCILHFLIPRPPSCVKWDGIKFSPFESEFTSPSSLIILIIIFFLMFLHSDFVYGFKITFLFGFFFISATISSILSGSSSINQTIFSIAIGSWVYFLCSFLPLISIPIIILFISILSFYFFLPILFSINPSEYFLRQCALPGIRASLLLLISVFLFFQYAHSFNDFKWTQLNWNALQIFGSNEDSVAIIPGILRITEEDSFGKKLNQDIIASTIAFIAVLISNIISQQLFNYKIYDLS